MSQPAKSFPRSRSEKAKLEAIMQNKEAIKVDIKTQENAKVSTKKQSAYIWIAENFPISFHAIFNALNFLAKGNKILSKLQDVLNSQV